jgi:hypothetical protein
MAMRSAFPLGLAGLALVAAGCGSSSSANRSATDPQGRQPGARFQALAKCLESKGFKLPARGQRRPGGGPPPGVNFQDPKFRAALRACRSKVLGNSAPPAGPGGPGGPPGGGAPPGQGGGTLQ